MCIFLFEVALNSEVDTRGEIETNTPPVVKK